MPTRLGPGLRDEQTADVAERRRTGCRSGTAGCRAQQPRLVELRGAGGPAELVVAVAPVVAADEHGDRRRRGRRPTGAVEAFIDGLPVGARHVLGRCERVRGRPVPRAALRRPGGRPRRARRRAAAAGSRDDRVEHVDARASLLASAPAAAARGRRGAPAAAARPTVESPVAANSSTTARWSGSSSSRQLEAGAAVALLEPQQRHAALAGVAVGVVGQVQAAAPAVVEGLDVVGRRARQRASRRSVLDEPPAAVRRRRSSSPAASRRSAARRAVRSRG